MPRSEGGSATDQPTTDQPSETDRVLEQRQGERGGQSATTTKTYTVKAGDTLSKIAKEHLGDANSYMKIFNANKDQLSDPDKIKPGQVLKIPV